MKTSRSSQGHGSHATGPQSELGVIATDGHKHDTISPHPPANNNLPPNGGTRAWLQVLGGFFLFMNSWGIVNTYGVYQTYYERNLLHQKSPSSISWIGSTQAFLLIFISVATGPLFDLGYFIPVLLPLGSVLIVFGMMMTSVCNHYWQVMLAQGVVIGLGCGCLFLPSVAIVSTYFTTKKAFATGIVAVGGSVGGVLYSLLFARLQPSIGFAWATRTIGFIALATLGISAAVLRVRVLPPARRRLLDHTAFREIPYTVFSIAEFLGFIGIYIPFFYIQSYALDRGVNPHLVFYLVTILNAASIFGRLGPNYVADRIGPLNVLIPCCIITALLGFCWIAIDSTAGIVVFCILYGFFSGAFVTLPPTIIVGLSPSLSVLGARMGMSFSLAAFGSLIGTPVAGVILKKYGWVGLQAFCGASVGAASIAIIVTRMKKTPRLMEKA
ncbi:MFS general substrate transporter [Lophium mytilinum]|uniref:MFS general substrate transporter n=1 Tax=Lophium mytilinum TaxID=390894 RepID=A0A6A6QFL6_9PEZI|nr:MFS general substrate transporter [Lophium mytilinum]